MSFLGTDELEILTQGANASVNITLSVDQFGRLIRLLEAKYRYASQTVLALTS